MHEDLHFFHSPKKYFLGELVGISYCDGSYYQARKNSDVTVLEYVVKGEGTVKVNGISHSVKEGDVYLLPLYTNHIYFSSDSNPWIKYFINIRGNLPIKLIESYNLQNQYIFKNSNTKELFLQLYETAKEPMDETIRQEIFASIVLKIVMRLNACVKGYKSVDEISMIKSIIDNSPGKIYTIAELSEIAHRSKDYIIKNFIESYGITPHKYIINKKIDTAKIFLADTDLSIFEISISLGYNNVEYFSTQFKKVCKMSPLEYRKSIKDESTI